MTRIFAPALCLALLLAAGCSLPRIVVHDDPLSAQEHFQLGMAYEQDAEYELALREYKEASDEVPMAHLYMGNVHFAQQEFDKAERQYRKAIKALPENPRPYNNLAWLYFVRKDKLDKAEELAVRAVELAAPEERAPYQDTLDQIRALRAEQ
jgi:tetratricopeptide (TPR) repeat protein